MFIQPSNTVNLEVQVTEIYHEVMKGMQNLLYLINYIYWLLFYWSLLFSLIEKFRLHAQDDKADYLEKMFTMYINRPVHEGSIPVS